MSTIPVYNPVINNCNLNGILGHGHYFIFLIYILQTAPYLGLISGGLHHGKIIRLKGVMGRHGTR